MREYFCAYHSMLRGMRRLSDAECGRLFRALLAYSQDGTEPINLQGREEALFDVYADQIDRDIEKYESKCKQLQANGSKSHQKQANGSKSKQMEAKDGICAQDKDKDKGEYKGKDNTFGNSFEEEDENNTSTLSGASSVERLIIDQWRRDFGQAATPAQVRAIAQRAKVCHYTDEAFITEAINAAASRGASDPVAYILTLFSDWVQHGIKTLDEFYDYVG